MDSIEAHHSVLIIYENNENLDNFVNSFKNKPNNISSKRRDEVLKLQPISTHDFVLSGMISPHIVQHDGELLSALLKLAKPDGKIIINQAVRKLVEGSNQLISQLKLSGFIKISESVNVSLSADEKKEIQEKLNMTNDVEVIQISCSKPNFEVGSSAKLNLKPKADVHSVWKLDDTMDEDIETIDPDNLLDDDDIKKPDAPLKVCSTTGKRKACKDCSCGLAEELKEEKDAKSGYEQNKDVPKSSCGSCYLGDAFRCATCPYLGMPAFKPGEKIQLSTDQLQPDL